MRKGVWALFSNSSSLPLIQSQHNPSAVLEFSKMYKCILKLVIFSNVAVTTKNDQINDQLLSSNLKSTYPLIKFGHLSWSFLVGFYPMTKSGHVYWSFLVNSL